MVLGNFVEFRFVFRELVLVGRLFGVFFFERGRFVVLLFLVEVGGDYVVFCS